ncbi:MAG: hypothetical protein K1X57_18890 [Gemmataceae bacterium]|nr:hypothetical protein [Gemmataceae bacterium]
MSFAPLVANLINYPKDMAGAMITASCVAAFGIAFAYTFANLSHIFTAVADTTAGGRDEVGWSSEPMIDRLTKAGWLAWALLVSLAPAFIISRVLPAAIGNWAFLGLFGLVFPVVYLSLQTGQSAGSVLHPDVLVRMARRPDYLIAFSVCSLLVTLGIGLGIRFSVLSAAWCVPFGAALLAWSLMAWARLIGRLAHMISRVRIRVRQKSVPRPPAPRRPAPAVARVETARTEDESAYGLRPGHLPEPEVDEPAPSLKRIWVEEGADDPYAFADGGPNPEPRPPLPDAIAKPSDYEVELAVGSRPMPPPPMPWINGTFLFPLRPANWPALVTLSLCLIICAALARTIISG